MMSNRDKLRIARRAYRRARKNYERVCKNRRPWQTFTPDATAVVSAWNAYNRLRYPNDIQSIPRASHVKYVEKSTLSFVNTNTP